MGLDRPSTKPPQQELERIAEEWMEQIWRRHNLEAINQLHAPNFIDHSSAGRNTDNDAYKAGIADLYVAFPDFFAQTDDLVPDPTSGKIAIRWSATGTHSATFFGIPASGKQVKFTGIEILYIQNNRIIERWGEWDGLAILNQLM